MLVSFFDYIKDNFQFVCDNIFALLIWGGLCVEFTCKITSRYSKKIQEENEILRKELDALKAKYALLDENTRLLMGRECDFPQTSAEIVSDRIRKK